ncbi:MAG: LiaI-LiaF-like domain-containing protein [Sphingomonadaceae bacterium]
MRQDNGFQWRKQLIWGLLFIGVGSAMLLDRAGLLELDLDLARLWHYWPVLLVITGLIQMIPPTSARFVINGLWKIFFAAWWYVSFEHLWGLDFSDTWPALIVASGLGMVLQPILAKELS